MESGVRGGRGGGGAVHRGSEWTRTRTTTQSGSLEVRTARTRPFCSSSGLHPQQDRKRSEGRTGDGLPPGCVTLSYFPPGATIMPERQRSPAELSRLCEEAQD